MTLRAIPGIPPDLDTLHLPVDLKTTIFPEYGLVLIVGTTGSGKSTLLSPCNRQRLTNVAEPVKILTYERSEDHTSELQSIMRKPYTILCLQKHNPYTERQT